MADKCGATHPEHPELTCLLGYPHEEHTARGAEGLTHWPNEAWVRQTNPHQPMKDMSFESLQARMPVNVYRRGAPTNGTAPSDAAAASIEPVRGQMQLRVLEAVREHGPLTCEAVERLLDASHQSVSARLKELKEAGMIQVTGQATNRSGRVAWTYEVS